MPPESANEQRPAHEPIHVQSHPSERGKRCGVILCSPGCCCCCCCLHGIGGLLGAAIATFQVAGSTSRHSETLPNQHPERFLPPEDRPGSEQITEKPTREPPRASTIRPEPREVTEVLPARTTWTVPPAPDVRKSDSGPGWPGVRLYWLTVVCLLPVASVWIYLETSGAWGPLTPPGVLIFLLFYFPLIQLVASLVSAVLVLVLVRDQPEASWWAIGKITLFSILGAMLGALGCIALSPYM